MRLLMARFAITALLLVGCLFANRLAAEDAKQPDPYARVLVPVCKTSIYVGTVTMKMGTFVRHGEYFEAPYEANVFPFFFYSEKGSLRIEVGTPELAKLAKGEAITLRGTATSSKGELRRVEGSANPENQSSGRLKIRVYVTKSIKLAFPTSYSFPDFSSTTTSPSSK